MRSLFATLTMAACCLAAGGVRLDEPVYCGGTDDLLQYDDGSAVWLTWGGLYRGTWFDTQDFVPGSIGLECNYTEYWFYHHSSYPWDTSSFYAELWNGSSLGPLVLLDQTMVTAAHFAPVQADYNPPIATEQKFWGLVNTEMSAGGWPAVLGDNTPNTTDHSFYSDDFIVWEPWIISGATASDYLLRAEGWMCAFGSSSWGAMKGLYR